MPDSSLGQNISSRGRYWRTPCCGARVYFKPGQVWRSRTGLDPRSELRIVECDKDGAIVEQLDRPQDGPFGLGYRYIAGTFERVGSR